jgi:DNA primase
MSEIIDVIGKIIKLEKSGMHYMGLCPFHEETSPSFTVDPKTESWHCFGCGVGGNIKDFQDRYEQFKQGGMR